MYPLWLQRLVMRVAWMLGTGLDEAGVYEHAAELSPPIPPERVAEALPLAQAARGVVEAVAGLEPGEPLSSALAGLAPPGDVVTFTARVTYRTTTGAYVYRNVRVPVPWDADAADLQEAGLEAAGDVLSDSPDTDPSWEVVGTEFIGGALFGLPGRT